MADFNVADRVLELCKARSWSLYRLAHEADMPYSSLSTVLYKTASPSLVSIEKICSGFGITLSQFFSEDWQNSRWMNGSACHTGRRLAQRTKN